MTIDERFFVFVANKSPLIDTWINATLNMKTLTKWLKFLIAFLVKLEHRKTKATSSDEHNTHTKLNVNDIGFNVVGVGGKDGRARSWNLFNVSTANAWKCQTFDAFAFTFTETEPKIEIQHRIRTRDRDSPSIQIVAVVDDDDVITIIDYAMTLSANDNDSAFKVCYDVTYTERNGYPRFKELTWYETLK